jgi:hypothetical protein
MQTSIVVDSEVKERLAVMARERGMTIREMLTDMVGLTPTPEQVAARAEAAKAYIREHLCPDIDDEDNDAQRLAEWTWAELRAGRIPNLLEGPPPRTDVAA